jgi:hypothetical protein
MILNNPDVDEIVEVETRNRDGITVWHETNNMLLDRKATNEIDLYFSTQIISDNEKNYVGTIRSSLLRNYPHKITTGTKPYVFLTEDEIQNVKAFVEKNNITKYKNIVLFECAPVSGQVAINPVIATQIAESVVKRNRSTCFILTSGEKIISSNDHIYDASSLSIRENAELVNHCTHLIGCSSGISWISTSTWCKELPTLQFLNNRAFFFNSLLRDFKYLNEDAGHIIETDLILENGQAENVISIFLSDFTRAHNMYNRHFKDHSNTIYTLCRKFILKGEVSNAIKIIKNCFRLNADNYAYYFKIVRLLIMFPLFQSIRIANIIR